MSSTSTSTDPTLEHGLIAPISPAIRSMLRTAVVEHARSERRLLYPPHLHVGTPGGFRVSTPIAEAPSDFGTRVDLVHAMVRRAEIVGVGTSTRVPWVWLTRSGPATPDDLDLTVMAPTIHAFAEARQPLTYVVVTRRGWHDPRSGLHRSWQRIRAA